MEIDDDRRYRMVYASGRHSAAADDPATLLAELIPGYPGVPASLRRMVRVAHAERSLHRIQRRVLTAYGSLGCDSDELQVLLNDPANRPVPEKWSAPVPLVLIDAHFIPGQSPARPREAGGQIVWLETHDEDAYLRSLAVAGEIFLIVQDQDQFPEGTDRSAIAGAVSR